MSKKFQQLQQIRSWSVEEVQEQLRRHGLSECCEGIRRREVDGDTLLALTEGQLALWREINIATKKQLLKFLEDVKTEPAKYADPREKPTIAKKPDIIPNEPPVSTLPQPIAASESVNSSYSGSPISDTGSWGTDFSDDKPEEVEYMNNENVEPPQRPPVPARPPIIDPKPDTNLPKPPLPPEHSCRGHVLNIVSSLNLQEHHDAFDDDEYESLDTGATVRLREEVAALMRAPVQQDTYEAYESIKEQEIPNQSSETAEYYLEPIQPQPAPTPPVPDKKWVLPKQPSPSRRLSDDGSTHTSPGNSGDGVTGLLEGFFRKIRGPDSKERTPTPTTPTSTLKPLPPESRAVTVNTHRPLPPTPEAKGAKSPHNPKLELMQQPWYHEVDRKQSVELLKNGEDGSFLVRPSSQSQNALTLTLWYNGRIYNINVRHRLDGRYALGTEKANEQSFTSIEELVHNYQSEKLVLYSGGEKTGRALLKSSPPKS